MGKPSLKFVCSRESACLLRDVSYSLEWLQDMSSGAALRYPFEWKRLNTNGVVEIL